MLSKCLFVCMNECVCIRVRGVSAFVHVFVYECVYAYMYMYVRDCTNVCIIKHVYILKMNRWDE